MIKLLVDRPNRAYDRMGEPQRLLTFLLPFTLLLTMNWWLVICSIGLWRAAYILRNTEEQK
jgi:hypothetical protein